MNYDINFDDLDSVDFEAAHESLLADHFLFAAIDAAIEADEYDGLDFDLDFDFDQ
jgi:hypothetical protein